MEGEAGERRKAGVAVAMLAMLLGCLEAAARAAVRLPRRFGLGTAAVADMVRPWNRAWPWFSWSPLHCLLGLNWCVATYHPTG